MAALLVASAFASVPSVQAQTSVVGGGTIEAIDVRGTQRVEAATVVAYLGVKVGDSFDPVALDRALKSLFSTGLFADATLTREINTLVVTVLENPLVNRVAFEGNRKIDQETLEAEIQLRPRTVYTRAKVQSDVQRMLELYRRKGYFAATIEPKLIQLDQNRVDLVFEINEGAITGISSINFIGNRAFSDSSLRGEITTTETAFWRFLSDADTYDPDRLNFDRELLRRFYLTEGYADFRVVSAVAELSPNREGFIVTFTVEEGELYQFGTIDISTTLKNLDTETLRSELTTVEGDTYNASAVDESMANLTEKIGNLGYAFVAIEPRVQRDPVAHTIGLTYEISEGPKVYVERIDIEGNSRTLDRVIRREFRLVEGDAFNSSKLQRSRQRIQNLGYFSVVNVTNVPGSTPDKTVVKVKVEEQSTGDFSFGLGYSTDNGPLGNIAIRERNLLGRGQDLRVNLTISGRASQVDLSFTEPYFLDRDLSAGFDLFRITRTEKEADYTEERLGGSLRSGWSWSENFRQVVRYTLELRTIRDVGAGASSVIVEDEGTRIKSAVATTLTYDVRDNRFSPTEGYLLSFDSELAGLGGDSSFITASVSGAYYLELFDDVVMKVAGDAGFIQGLAEDTRISDRFFIGGGNLRGFAVGGIGPRDTTSGDALGAKNYYTGTIELQFPLGLPDEFQIKGRAFADVGAAWGYDGSTGTPADSSAPRASVGFGISWNSPFGPLAVDFGIPLIKEDFDETESFRFDFGANF